jgi:hypothetical protein
VAQAELRLPGCGRLSASPGSDATLGLPAIDPARAKVHGLLSRYMCSSGGRRYLRKRGCERAAQRRARSDEGAAAWICPRGLHRVHECDGLARIQLHVPVPALRCDFASKDGPESRIDIWSDPNNGQAVREPFALRWHSIITSAASLLGEAHTAFGSFK